MATATFLFFILLSVALAILSRGKGRHEESRDYFVAAGQFGSVLLFFLSVGEIYSVGLLTGFPGGVFAKGKSFCIWYMSFILLAYPVGYFLGPAIWRAAQKYRPITVADLFVGHYKNRTLELVVALTAILFMLPWGVVQFLGLGMAIEGLGLQHLRIWFLAGAGVITLFYISLSGIRAPAYVSILKDSLLLASIAMVGVAVLWWPSGREAVHHAAIGLAKMPVSSTELNFIVSTILFQGLGFYMFPGAFSFLFTARSAQTIRRAQIFMPLYMVLFPLLALIALYAQGSPELVSSPNHLFIDIGRSLLPQALLGVIAAGAAVSALVVLAGTCLVISPLFSRNVLRVTSDRAHGRLSRIISLVYLVVSIVWAERASTLAAVLGNLSFYGMAQFLPGVLGVSLGVVLAPSGVAAGIVVGSILGIGLPFTHIVLHGINPGMIGLVLNFGVVAAATLIARARQTARRHPALS